MCYNLFKSQLFLMDSLPLGLVSVWSTPTYKGAMGYASFQGARDELYGKGPRTGQTLNYGTLLLRITCGIYNNISYITLHKQ